VVFGPDHIDTSRAEMLVQSLSNISLNSHRFFISIYFPGDKIKEKLIGINEGRFSNRILSFFYFDLNRKEKKKQN